MRGDGLKDRQQDLAFVAWNQSMRNGALMLRRVVQTAIDEEAQGWSG